ncbi:hypothetical protein Dsin_025557 [Dipteronia sinensis]|uniref:Reverse transcriptase zinc-binding domain-containing protein n=1 Tax=Dipteronia sinensis TaxID=43782 RepID=A0AAD9ZWI9_9ROSI|nr:hypothetical protein Dsin_025557 [Dipteronia sinensis]
MEEILMEIQSPKVKLLVWRACHDWLPVNWNLAKREVSVDWTCLICMGKPDSMLHTDKDVAPWAADFLIDYRRANDVMQENVGMCLVDGAAWRPPDEGLFKMNTDAAINLATGRVGFGIVIRNIVGDVLASSSQVAVAYFPLMVAKLCPFSGG